MFDVVVPIVFACSKKSSTFSHVPSMFRVHRSTLAHEFSIAFAQFRTDLDAIVTSRHTLTSSLNVNRQLINNPNNETVSAPNTKTTAPGGTTAPTTAPYVSHVCACDVGRGGAWCAAVLARRTTRARPWTRRVGAIRG